MGLNKALNMKLHTLSCDKHDHFRKFSADFDLYFLSQFFVKIENQGQFWNPHDEQISKLSLIFNFDKEMTEKMLVKERKWSCLSHDSVIYIATSKLSSLFLSFP